MSVKSMFNGLNGLDEKSVDFLTSSLAKNNLPGFDYLEFKQSLGNLSALGMDESTALRSAYATAATVGLTKDKLLKTAEHYKSVLNREKEQFDVALQKQIDQKVKAKQTEVDKLRKQVEDYMAKIRELESRISEAQKTIADSDGVIQAAMEKIETTKDGFETTLKVLMNEIDRDIQNIQHYL
jgi:chromosome segregation ATPase